MKKGKIKFVFASATIESACTQGVPSSFPGNHTQHLSLQVPGHGPVRETWAFSPLTQQHCPQVSQSLRAGRGVMLDAELQVIRYFDLGVRNRHCVCLKWCASTIRTIYIQR